MANNGKGRKKHVLVTGGAGFIGSHLCEKLLEKDYKVTSVDNLFTGTLDNIKHLRANPHFEFREHNIIDPLYIQHPINRVYNLACPASPIHYQFNPVETVKANTAGVINMLGIAKKHKARILQASTSEVYGDPIEHPQTEEYRGNVSTIGPRACYDEGKRVAETLFFDYHRQHGVDIRVVRIFNTYGSNMHPNDGRVVSNFIVQALNNLNITIYGDGSQSRSFQYVDDLVNGMMKMMESESDFLGPVNLGNPIEFTMNELAQKVLEAIPESKSRLVYKDLPQDDPKQRKPNIELAKTNLNWEPKISLEEGLKPTISYFKKRLEELEARGEDLNNFIPYNGNGN